MKLCFVIFLLLLCMSSALWAERQQSYAQKYIKSYPESIGKAVSAPLSWDGEGWLTAGALVLSAGTIYLADEEINDFVQRKRSDFSETIMTGAKQFGEGKYVLPALGATILGAYILDSEKSMDTGLLSLKSFILANGVTLTLKTVSQRRRPSADRGKEFFAGSGFDRKRDSFPSGHSTIVWSIAPILAEQYRDKIWVAPAAYSIATLTSISRVHDNNHWASDAFVGAVIGYVSAKLVLGSTPRLQLLPNPELAGVNMYFLF